MTFSAAFLLLALGFLGLAGHCFVFYPLSLRMFLKRMPPPILAAPDAPRPSIAICMCAYNEEILIVAKIVRLLEVAAHYGPATIHVYADAPSDSTAELLRPFADKIDLVIGEVRSGKTYGMSVLAARSESELILFTDANVVSDENCAWELARPFADPTIGCVTAHLVYSNKLESATSAIGALYWRLEEAIKKVESETVGVIGVDGAMFVIRRALYQPPPPHLIDDLYLSLRILIAGSRIYSADHVRVCERNAIGAAEEKLRKRRIACQAANVDRALWPELKTLPAQKLYAYLSHRVMKWLMPFFIGASAFCTLVAITSHGGVALAGALICESLAALGIGHFLNIRPFSIISSAALSLYGVAVGVLESLFRRKTYAVWDPAISIRSETLTGSSGKKGDTNAS